MSEKVSLHDVRGVLIHTIVRGGPADDAGLRGSTRDQFGQEVPGDLIVAVNGHNIDTFEDLFFYLETEATPHHQQITLGINNHGIILNIPVEVSIKDMSDIFYCQFCI